MVAPFVSVPDVTTPHWTRFVSKTVPYAQATGNTDPMICSIVDPPESLASELIFRDDENCYYGHSSHDGSTFPLSGTSWDLYMKSGKKTE